MVLGERGVLGGREMGWLSSGTAQMISSGGMSSGREAVDVEPEFTPLSNGISCSDSVSDPEVGYCSAKAPNAEVGVVESLWAREAV